jgi:hypothetical protein
MTPPEQIEGKKEQQWEFLNDPSKHYFVSFTVIGGRTQEGHYYWVPSHAVINCHPFDFIKRQRRSITNDSILLSWQEITEDEYFLFAATFNYPIYKSQPQ